MFAWLPHGDERVLDDEIGPTQKRQTGLAPRDASHARLSQRPCGKRLRGPAGGRRHRVSRRRARPSKLRDQPKTTSPTSSPRRRVVDSGIIVRVTGGEIGPKNTGAAMPAGAGSRGAAARKRAPRSLATGGHAGAQGRGRGGLLARQLLPPLPRQDSRPHSAMYGRGPRRPAMARGRRDARASRRISETAPPFFSGSLFTQSSSESRPFEPVNQSTNPNLNSDFLSPSTSTFPSDSSSSTRQHRQSGRP